jgi:hypothetical protein
MKTFLKSIQYLFILLILASCATGGRKDREALRGLVAKGQYNDALKHIKASRFFQNKDTKLLKHYEKGLIFHLMGSYYQSILELEKAKELGKKLYTVSLSKKAKTLVTNESYDIYYGTKYEQSLVHFYLALNHYLLYQKGEYESYTKLIKKEKPLVVKKKALSKQEKRNELYKARAEIVAWDSLLTTWRNERSGRKIYKNDLMAKVFGGYIHETIDTINDRNIALQLYKDANKLLFQNYNSYKTFNKSHIKFNKNFSKLPSMSKSKVESEYISKTKYQSELGEYLTKKILILTKKIRPRDFKKQVRILKPSKSILKEVKNNNKKPHNVALVLQKGFIPKKVASQQYFGLGKAIAGNSGAAKVGGAILTYFAADVLGLLPPPNSYNPAGAYLGLNVASAAVSHAAISFELPKIEDTKISDHSKIEIYNKAGKLIKTESVPVINPLGDIAGQAVEEDAASLYPKLGARLASKHIVAILASYATYESLKRSSGGKFLAKNAAVIQYLAATKAIAASEKADTRQWSTLPGSLRMIEVYLPKGEYALKLKVNNHGNAKRYNLGQVKVVNENTHQLVNFRTDI